MDDHLLACLQYERRRRVETLEELRALLRRHGLKLDHAGYARMATGSCCLAYRCLGYSEAVAAGVVFG